MAYLDGHGITVPFIGSVGHFPRGNALDDLSLQSHDKIAAGLCCLRILEAIKIIPVILRGASRIGRVMDDHSRDIVCADTRSGIRVHIKELNVKLRLGSIHIHMIFPACQAGTHSKNDS